MQPKQIPNNRKAQAEMMPDDYDPRSDDAYDVTKNDVPVVPQTTKTRMERIQLRVNTLANALAKAEDALEREKARLENIPQEPINRSVVSFTKTFHRGGKRYDFCAIRIDKVWYLSGSANYGGNRTLSWEELCEFADAQSLRLCGTWIRYHDGTWRW